MGCVGSFSMPLVKSRRGRSGWRSPAGEFLAEAGGGKERKREEDEKKELRQKTLHHHHHLLLQSPVGERREGRRSSRFEPLRPLFLLPRFFLFFSPGGKASFFSKQTLCFLTEEFSVSRTPGLVSFFLRREEERKKEGKRGRGQVEQRSALSKCVLVFFRRTKFFEDSLPRELALSSAVCLVGGEREAEWRVEVCLGSYSSTGLRCYVSRERKNKF